jgi:hypothetical protein
LLTTSGRFAATVRESAVQSYARVFGHRAIRSVTVSLYARSPCHDRAAMYTTRQREHWDGDPIELGDAWALRKGEKIARCILVAHPLG